MHKTEIFFDVLNIGDCNAIRIWRNEIRESLRTPHYLTYEMQLDFYNNVVCNKLSNSRYWGIYSIINELDHNDSDNLDSKKNIIACGPMLVGMAGINNIQWENGIGEISLLIGGKYKKLGYGSKSLNILVDKAFDELRLENIYGEYYQCNPNKVFWEKYIKKFGLTYAVLPARKYHNGNYYDSVYFNINSLDREVIQLEEIE